MALKTLDARRISSRRAGQAPGDERGSSRRVSLRAGGRRGEGRGSRVMWLMILIGMALSAGFVLALRSQINAYKIAQAEERLKMKLDEYADQQRFLALDERQALSAKESERAGRRNGLVQLRLGRDEDWRNASVRGIVSRPPVGASQAGRRDRPSATGKNDADLTNRPAKPGSQAKVVKSIKAGKTAKIVNVVKVSSSRRESGANRVKANVAKTRKKRIEDR